MTWKIIDEKFQKAIKDGQFDNLEGTGEPLDLDYLQDVPEEFRMAYTILKNANVIPPEMELRKEIAELEKMIEDTVEEEERIILQKKLSIKIAEYAIIREKFR